MAQVVALLPSNCKALSLNPGTIKKRKKEEKQSMWDALL
jgi:hypothetical protein